MGISRVSMSVFALLAVVSFGTSLSSATVTWDGGQGPSGGSGTTYRWDRANNWGADAAPGSADDVLLDRSATDDMDGSPHSPQGITIQMTKPPGTIQSFTVAAHAEGDLTTTLDLGGETLTISNAGETAFEIEADQSLTIGDGTIVITGNSIIAGTLIIGADAHVIFRGDVDFTDGMIQSDADGSDIPTITFDAATAAADIAVDGGMNMDGVVICVTDDTDGDVNFDAIACDTVEISGNGNVNCDGNAMLSGQTNRGAIDKNGTGAFAIEGSLIVIASDASGLVDLNAGSITVAETGSSIAGNVDAEDETTLTVASSSTFSGATVDLGATGGSVDIGDVTFDDTTTLTVRTSGDFTGTITIDDGAVVTWTGDMSNSDTVTIGDGDSGSLTVTGETTIAEEFIISDGATFTSTGALSIEFEISLGEEASLTGSDAVTIGADVTIGVDSTMTATGALSVTSGVVMVNGELVASSITMNGDGEIEVADGGAVDASGVVMMDDDILTIADGGSFEVGGSLDVSTADLENAGTIVVDGEDAMLMIADTTNLGDVTFSANSSVVGDFSDDNDGTITVDAGVTVTFTGDSVTFDSIIACENSGTIAIGGAADQTLVPAEDNVDLGNLSFPAGAADRTVSVMGEWFGDDEDDFTGDMSIAATVTLSFSDDANFSQAGEMTNEGLVVFDAEAAESSIDVTGCTFLTGAVTTITDDSSGNVFFTDELDNITSLTAGGSVAADEPSTGTTSVDADFETSGDVIVIGANLDFEAGVSIGGNLTISGTEAAEGEVECFTDGTVTVTGDVMVSAATNNGSFTMEDASAAFGGAVMVSAGTDGGTTTFTVGGDASFDGNVDLVSGDDVTVIGAVSFEGSAASTVAVGDIFEDTVTVNGEATVTFTGETTFPSTFTVTEGASAAFDSAFNMSNNVTVEAEASLVVAGDMSFGGDEQTLSIDATASVSFDANVMVTGTLSVADTDSGDSGEAPALTIGGDLVLGEDDTAASFSDDGEASNDYVVAVTFGGNVTFADAEGATFDLSSSSATFSAAATHTFSVAGNASFDTEMLVFGDTTISNTLSFDGFDPEVTTLGFGGMVSIAADMSLDAVGMAVTFTGDLSLAAGASIMQDEAAPGAVTFLADNNDISIEGVLMLAGDVTVDDDGEGNMVTVANGASATFTGDVTVANGSFGAAEDGDDSDDAATLTFSGNVTVAETGMLLLGEGEFNFAGDVDLSAAEQVVQGPENEENNTSPMINLTGEEQALMLHADGTAFWVNMVGEATSVTQSGVMYLYGDLDLSGSSAESVWSSEEGASIMVTDGEEANEFTVTIGNADASFGAITVPDVTGEGSAIDDNVALNFATATDGTGAYTIASLTVEGDTHDTDDENEDESNAAVVTFEDCTVTFDGEVMVGNGWDEDGDSAGATLNIIDCDVTCNGDVSIGSEDGSEDASGATLMVDPSTMTFADGTAMTGTANTTVSFAGNSTANTVITGAADANFEVNFSASANVTLGRTSVMGNSTSAVATVSFGGNVSITNSSFQNMGTAGVQIAGNSVLTALSGNTFAGPTTNTTDYFITFAAPGLANGSVAMGFGNRFTNAGNTALVDWNATNDQAFTFGSVNDNFGTDADGNVITSATFGIDNEDADVDNQLAADGEATGVLFSIDDDQPEMVIGGGGDQNLMLFTGTANGENTLTSMSFDVFVRNGTVKQSSLSSFELTDGTNSVSGTKSGTANSTEFTVTFDLTAGAPAALGVFDDTTGEANWTLRCDVANFVTSTDIDIVMNNAEGADGFIAGIESVTTGNIGFYGSKVTVTRTAPSAKKKNLHYATPGDKVQVMSFKVEAQESSDEDPVSGEQLTGITVDLTVSGTGTTFDVSTAIDGDFSLYLDADEDGVADVSELLDAVGTVAPALGVLTGSDTDHVITFSFTSTPVQLAGGDDATFIIAFDVTDNSDVSRPFSHARAAELKMNFGFNTDDFVQLHDGSEVNGVGEGDEAVSAVTAVNVTWEKEAVSDSDMGIIGWLALALAAASVMAIRRRRQVA